MKQPFKPPHTDQLLADEQALLAHYRQHSQAQPTPAMDALILAAATAELSRVKPHALNWGQRLHLWLFGPGHQLRWSLALGSLASIGLGLTLSLRNVEQLPPAYDLGAPLPALSSVPAPAAVAEPMAKAKQLPASAPVLAESMADEQAESSRVEQPLDKPQGASQGAPLSAPARVATAEKKAEAPLPERALGELNVSRELSKQAAAVGAPASNGKSDAHTADAALPAEQQSPAAFGEAKDVATMTFAQQLQALLVLQRSGASAAAALELQRMQQRYPEHDVAAELRKLQAGPR